MSNTENNQNEYLQGEESFDDFENPHIDNNKKRSLFKPKLKKPSFLISVLINTFRIIIVSIICIAIAIIGVVFGIGRAYVDTSPDLDLNLIDDQAKTTFIYDSNGNLITDFKGLENRVMVGINYVPKHLQEAFVAAEDIRFYKHNGIDVQRIAGAFINNIFNNSVQGGSTITQQLIKNTLLSNEMSYKRKIQEAYLAMQLEQKYTKDQIMEAYLNTIYLGENYYGVKVAANGYFNKELHQLSLRECAMLAGITSNPYYYNPQRNFYTRKADNLDYVAITNNRTNYVLRQMYDNHFITKEEYNDALNPMTANVVEKSPTLKMYKYPHYIEYAINEAIDDLLKIKGLENSKENRSKIENEIATGGYHIRLAIDTEIQEIVEDTLENWNKYPSLANKNDSILRTKNSDGTFNEVIQPQAAAAVLDYRTGELKAIVGSRTRPTQRKTLNRACDMNMPVGSAIKPIAVFGPAIDMGANPASIVYNMPLPIEGWKNEKLQDTWPKNYGGGSYNGCETMREAMVKSHNTGTASAFSLYVGVENSINYLKRLGVSEKNINPTPFGLALGSSGITPIQMSVAYGVFGNGGIYQKPISILGISDSKGNVIFDAHKEQDSWQAVKPSTAWMMIDMLKDVVKSGTGRNTAIKGQVVAGKTGTNSEHRGVTYTGLTGWYCSSIWVGHDNYKPLSSKATGGGSAGAIWKSYMSKIHEKKGLDKREILQGEAKDYNVSKVSICSVSGQLATEACYYDYMGNRVINDYCANDALPQNSCQMHRNITVCADSNMPVGPNCPQEKYLEKSAVIIPQGHPLHKFAGTQYENVIRQYLGEAVIFAGFDYDLSDDSICNVHGIGVEENHGQNIQNDKLMQDANNLINIANTIINNPENHDVNSINSLIIAVSTLQNSINNNEGSETIYNNMISLTEALAAIN